MSTYGCCNAMCASWCTTTALASKIPRFLTNWTCMEHDVAVTYAFSRTCHNHCRITMGARCLGQCITVWHSAPLWPFACKNTCLSCHQRGCTVYWCDCLGTPYCDMCASVGLNLISYTPIMINYLSHQFAIQWTCPWGCCTFFQAVYILFSSVIIMIVINLEISALYLWYLYHGPLDNYNLLAYRMQYLL